MNLLINIFESFLTLFTKEYKLAFNIYAYNFLDSGTKLL